MPYLKLFHGRKDPVEQLNDWGEDGPVFGPFPFFHTRYGSAIRFDPDRDCNLTVIDDLVYYDGMFYGDWSIFDVPHSDRETHRVVVFDPLLAEVPVELLYCECQQLGRFNCGVPGILAPLENGRLLHHDFVERCDRCQRYPDDAAARRKLDELGLLWSTEPPDTTYHVHCYSKSCLTIHGIVATSARDAARIAAIRYDTGNDFAGFSNREEELEELVVDVDGVAGANLSRRFNLQFEELEL